MRDGPDTLLDTLCSTGSYAKLEAANGLSWFFHTPRGQFKVLNKKKDPVWVAPDWDYWERKEPIPSARSSDRLRPNVMGDYALGFGNGYYIHGTLYNRLIGQSVTHGCVRLDDAPLEQVYRTAPIGTPIFIY
ncbi:MAG: ErfK/YbiS/YcfS/YnhG family protein [bacterium]|nr:MAG: ErfK/YbiS/YcfS/YnhG family protein [bacterium]